MIEISNTNVHEARFRPEVVFDGPETLELDSALTRGQKIATLDRWAADVEDRLTAASEGMVGELHSHADDANLLRRIGKVRHRLVASNPAEA